MNASTRINIQQKAKQRDYNRRKGVVEMLVRQNNGNVEAAIEQYKTQLCGSMQEIPEYIENDLKQIGRELSYGGKPTAS